MKMDDDLRFWLLIGFLLIILAWAMAMTSCVQQRPTEEPMTELQRTPTDTILSMPINRSE
jgi:hypothetical protein